MIKAVLFDLDATLLPMDQDLYLKTYIGSISKYMASYGYDPAELADVIWKGSYAMIKNDGKRLNSEVFWEYFNSRYGANARDDEKYFDEFYRTKFKEIKSICGCDPTALRLVEMIKERGVCVALATSPVFPAVATNERIGWAGLTPEHFELITTYDNVSYCKPNPKYYESIAEMLGVSPEECIMIGNDVDDDMPAALAGMQVYLVTDNLINKSGIDINKYPNGTLAELIPYISDLLS